MTDTWGTLPKSQIDPATVDEEIDTKIQTHLDDPDAHIETGQSLQSHKASTIIDHLARSIVSDKIQEWVEITALGSFSRNDFHWFTIFESIDAYEQWGDVYLQSEGLFIDTPAMANEHAGITKFFDYLFVPLNWTTDRRFKASIFLSDNSDQIIQIGIGGIDENIGKVLFKIVDLAVYGLTGDGDNESTISLGSITQDIHLFEAYFTPGVSVEFYIDGVLVGTKTTNLPNASSGSGGIPILIDIKTEANYIKELVVYCWDCWISDTA